MKISVLWAACSLINEYQHYGGTSCFHL